MNPLIDFALMLQIRTQYVVRYNSGLHDIHHL